MSDLTSLAKVTVLIVEDEPLVRMIAVEIIEEAGFEVLEAENATDAVRILESRLDIRIVFTDIDMPGSMDGLKLAAAVRGRWPPIAIVVTSGHHTVAADELPVGSVYIPKPYQHHQVIAVLRQMAGGPQIDEAVPGRAPLKDAKPCLRTPRTTEPPPIRS